MPPQELTDARPPEKLFDVRRWLRQPSRRRPIAVFLLVFGAAAIFSGGHSYSIDEETYLANLRAAVHFERTIEQLPPPGAQYLVVFDKDGGLTSFYGVGTVVFAIPAYAAGKAAAFTVGDPWKEMVLRLIYFGNGAVMLALTAALLVCIGLELGVRQRSATLVALTYATGTYAFAHSKTGFSETLTALFLTVAVLQLLRSRLRPEWLSRHVVGIGLALGAACMMRASALVFVAPFAIAVAWWAPDTRRVKAILYLGLGLAAPIALVALNNWWRFGNPLDTGYPTLRYNVPVYEGLFGLFLSSGKGLFWFAPLTLVAVLVVRSAWGTSRSLVALAATCIALNAATFARFNDWNGGNTFGPRYMIIVLPFFAVVVLAAAKQTAVDRAVAGSWILGGVTTIGGALVYFNAVYAANFTQLAIAANPTYPAGQADWGGIHNLLNFTPRFSQIVMHMRALPDVARNFRDTSFSNPPLHLFEGDMRGQLSLYQSELRLDTWWGYWIEVGAPKWVLLLLIVPIAAVYFGIRLVREGPERPGAI